VTIGNGNWAAPFAVAVSGGGRPAASFVPAELGAADAVGFALGLWIGAAVALGIGLGVAVALGAGGGEGGLALGLGFFFAAAS
jgi:hypothetical protein